MWDAVLGAAHARKALDVVVPGRDVLVANRPIGTGSVDLVRLEIDVAPAQAEASPRQRLAAHLVPAHPIERLRLDVRTVLFVGEELGDGLPEQSRLAKLRILRRVLERRHSVMRELPRILRRVHVVLHVLDVPAALEHEHLHALLAQLLRGQPSRDSGADYDRVILCFWHPETGVGRVRWSVGAGMREPGGVSTPRPTLTLGGLTGQDKSWFQYERREV